MKKFLMLVALLSIVFGSIVLPCKKAVAEGRVSYWICADCGAKAKTLKGYIPNNKVTRKNGLFEVIHYHIWEEVDYQTWLEW